MVEGSERRKTPRFPVPGRLGAKARATLDVHVVDISASGVRIEHTELLRPGATYMFELPPALGSLALMARIVHSAVVGTEKAPDGGRILRYQSGLAFLELTAEQQAALAPRLERLTPESGLGDGRLVM
ncbi:MAG TPA: PilZ domain-containing protein [Candidatus Methylomirabilis sp.]|nr:PilZ domain-containing protein [Candidatus Methylomirabilis sp.]